MKRPTIRLFALAALLLPLLGLAPSTSDTFQAIHVERNAFLDERGQPIVFRGVNVYDPLKLSSQSFFEEKYFKEAASWGANIVRQCVHPKTWSSTEQKIALGTLEQAITWAAESGIYSIIDWHSIGMPTRNLFENEMHVTTTDATIAFWKLMARTYKGDKRVAFYELFNEPSLLDSSSPPGAWIELRDWNEKVIDAIREIDPDKPIIVTGLDWGYNLKEVKGNPVRRKNLAYSAHPYPMKGLGWDEYFGFLKNDVAFINTEFGFDNQDSMLNEQSYTKNGGTGRYRDEIIKYFEQNKMSWVAWSFTLDWKPALFAGRDFKPTESGAFVKETLLRLNKGPTQPKTDAAKYVHADLLSDLKKANDVDSSNKSFKKKAFALSSESDQLLPKKAVDGNKSTRWASAFKEDPTWITVDLEKETEISKVVITWEMAFSKEYKIQVSNDAKAWTDVKYIKDGKGGTEEIAVNAKGRYLRVFAMKRASEWGTSIWEIEVY